jgi:hypothetical protein
MNTSTTGMKYASFDKTVNYPYEFSKYQDDYNAKVVGGSDYYNGGNSSLAIRGMGMDNTPLSTEYFSKENMKRIQKKIKQRVYEATNKKFKLTEDQDEMDLLIVMRAVFLDEGKNLPHKIISQVKILNNKTLDYLMPDLLTNLQQQVAYIKEINNPIQPHNVPLNVSNKGRKTLPSISTIWNL